MSADDVVVINDEDYTDPDIAVISATGCGIENNSQSIHTIVIDEDNAVTDQDDITEIIDIRNNNDQPTLSNIFERIVKENKLLAEFIEKCLDIEYSEGMMRAINRSLLPVYDSVTNDYKTSPGFRKLIEAKMRAVDVDPSHKFSHLRDMCETMKCHKKRKKVKLTTLSTDIKDNESDGIHLAAKRKKKDIDIIEVPIEFVPDPVIVLDEEPNDVIFLEDNQVINKENVIKSNVHENIKDNYIHNKPDFTEVPIINGEFGLNNDNHFLIPHKSQAVVPITDDIVVNRVKIIESRIAQYKKEIEKLEVLEVDTDTINSPYVRCERFKSEVVSMYKELCSLMGAEAVKRREVRLHVTNDQPELPVKKLEKLINDNIGDDGNPHFPDFYEVVGCVTQANNEANLGFSQAQISAEAARLFRSCGLALQAKRQKRDWRNMLGRVDNKLDNDPAEHDPLLLARLQENKRVGMRREEDLLESFVKMEYSRMNSVPTSNCNGNILITEDPSDESDGDEKESNASKTIGKGVVKNIIIENNELVARTSAQSNQHVLNEVNTRQKNNSIIANSSGKSDDIETECKDPSENIEMDVTENINDTNSKLVARTYQINCQEEQIESYTNQEANEVNVSTNTCNGNIPITEDPCVESDGDKRESNDQSENVAEDVIKHINDTNCVLQLVQNKTNIHPGEKETNVNITYPHSKSPIRFNNVQNIEVISITIINQDENSQEREETKEKTDETCSTLVTRIDNINKDDQNITSNVNNNVETHTLVQNIKTEPRDILKDIAQFTDNFTATIMYVEDPFLVIEISSDSSDGESDCETDRSY